MKTNADKFIKEISEMEWFLRKQNEHFYHPSYFSVISFICEDIMKRNNFLWEKLLLKM